MRVGPNVGYKSENGNINFVSVEEFLEYADFQHSSALKQFSGDVSEDPEVNQIDITMNSSDRARLVKDLAIEGVTSEVEDFVNKVDMGDGVMLSWRGVIVSFEGYQVKIYNKK